MKPFMTYYAATGKWYCRAHRDNNSLVVSSHDPKIAYDEWAILAARESTREFA